MSRSRLLGRVLAVGLLGALAVLAGAPAHAGAQAPRYALQEGTVAGWPLYRLTDPATALPPAQAGRSWRGQVLLTVDGRPRSFSVVVPAGLPRPAPVVLGLHGLYATRESTEAAMRLVRDAATRRFIAVYPAGSGASWNAGRCCGRAAAGRVDDVAMVRRVLAEVARVHPVDPRRVGAVGYSNGGMMAYKIACEAPGLLSAIAVVGGAYMTADTCLPRVATPTLVVHGREDGTVPLSGAGRSALLGTAVPSLAVSVAVMDRRNVPAGVPTSVVVLPRQGHGWPTLSSPGRYDASRSAQEFLLRQRHR